MSEEIEMKVEEQLSFEQQVINCCQVATKLLTDVSSVLSTLHSCFDKNIVKIQDHWVVDRPELEFLVAFYKQYVYIEQTKEWLISLEEQMKGI